MNSITVNKKNMFLFGTLILCFVFLIICHQRERKIDERDRKNRIDIMEEFIMSHGKEGLCKLPRLPVDAPEIMKFVKKEPQIDCSTAEPDWVTVDGSTCVITNQAKNKYGSIHCTFIDLIRVNDNLVRRGSSTTVINTTYTLRKSDVVKVHCYSKNKIWNAILMGIREDPILMNKTGWSSILRRDALKLNVLMFGFDSLSRNMFIRKLPKSYKYLTRILGAHVLEGYNIVGDGTPQALIPILTGQTELELPDVRKRVSGSASVDVYPFIWKEFKKHKYVTALLEDMPEIGTFHYSLNGFKEPPTDHYSRPYYLASIPFYSRSPKLCYGSVPRHKFMFNYIKNFFTYYKDKPKFLFGLHSELSHNSYNSIGAADDDFVKFLADLKHSKSLENTLLIIMSAHGHRLTELRNTVQGMQEERLPFFSFSFPTIFKRNHSKAYINFMDNKKSLTTPFDIYSTLKAVLSLRYTGPASLRERSLSLFSQIPRNRNCAHAYIEPHWCVCLDWIEISTDAAIVKELTNFFVKAINDYTEPYRRKCDILSYKQILSIEMLSPNDNLLRFKKTIDIDGFIADLSANVKITSNLYRIKIRLVPGDMVFNAAITYFLGNNKFSMKMSDVSRLFIDNYHVRCLHDNLVELKQFCHCIDEAFFI